MKQTQNKGSFDNSKVFFRIVPSEKMQWEHLKLLSNMKTIFMRYLQDFGAESRTASYWKFETDGVFYNNSQYEVYQAVTPGLVDKVVSGCNAVILAFGQTGSGKTLTSSGLQNAFIDRGISPRIIPDLFAKKESLKQNLRMCIQMSYIETNKQSITDLLDSNKTLDSHALKRITKIKVKDELSALKLLFQAEGRRTFSKGAPTSHLFHGVLTFYIMTKPLSCSGATITTSKIHIVDLAGTDSYGSKPSLHKNILELGNANLIKSQLEQFIAILNMNISKLVHVKLKLNILIEYLGDSLNAQSILRFIGHIRTDKENLVPTISMLRFGQCIRCLKPMKLQEHFIRFDEDVKDPVLLAKLEEFYRERDLNIMITNDDLSTNLTQDRIKHMQHVAQEYLQNKTNELVLISVTDADTVLKVFRNMYQNLEVEKEESTKVAYEKAYQDALATVQLPLKTESLKSLNKGSRKLSKPSETKLSESLTKASKTGSIAKRKTSASFSKNKSRESKSRMSDIGADKQIRHSKASSVILKKSSASKRKSSSITTGTSMSVPIDTIFEERILPDSMPPREEVWLMFTMDDNYRYHELLEMLQASEEKAINLKEIYAAEVNTLQNFANVLENRRIDYQKAQMQRLFKKQEYNEDGTIASSDLEKTCLDNLETSRVELLEQQEHLLKVQTEFCIALECYKNCKDRINDQYELYCQDKYNITIPKIEVPSIEVNYTNIQDASNDRNNQTVSGDKELEESLQIVKEPSYEITEEPKADDECSCSPEHCQKVRMYDGLKLLMKNQIRKQELERRKNQKWIQSCKA